MSARAIFVPYQLELIGITIMKLLQFKWYYFWSIKFSPSLFFRTRFNVSPLDKKNKQIRRARDKSKL